MLSALLIAHNDKEREILKLLLEQATFKVVDSRPNYANYLRSLQYKPEIVILEMPRYYTDELNYIRLIRKNRIVSTSSIIVYGDHSDRLIVNSFKSIGADIYFQRPLKSQDLLRSIHAFLERRGKSVTGKPGEKQEDRAEEVKLLLDRTVAGSRKMDIMVKSIGSLLAFPFAVAKVLQLTSDSESGAAEISKVILTDPVMTATILKLANSVLFASRDRKVTDIREAVVRIGFQETRRIVISLAVMKLFTKEEKSIGFDRLEFWYHSLACAVIAERLAKNMQYGRPAEAFVAGLLHDFGIILLDEFFPAIFGQIMDRTTKYGSSFEKEGREVLGISHNEMTQKLFELWKLPDPVIYSMRNHMGFTEAKPNVDKALNDLNRCVGLANVISKAMIFGRDVDFYVSPVTNQFFEEIRLPYGIDKRFIEEICVQLNMFSSYLKLDQRTFPPKESQIRGVENIRIAFYDRNSFTFSPFYWYLNSQHYNVRKLGNIEDIASVNKAVDIFILHMSAADGAEELKATLGRIRDILGPGEGGSPIPVVVIHSTGRVDLAQLKGEFPFRELGDTLDLRHLDRIVERCMGGDDTEPTRDLQISLNALASGERIIKVSGSMTINTLAAIRDTVNEFMAKGDSRIILDMEDVDYIDSSALRALVNLHKRMEKNGGLAIVRPSAKALSVLETSNLTKIFKVFKHESELVPITPPASEPVEAAAEETPASAITSEPETTPAQSDSGSSSKSNTDEASDVIESMSL